MILARLDALEAENQRLKLEVERAQAVNEIQRLIEPHDCRVFRARLVKIK